jgi:hypothetical protein
MRPRDCDLVVVSTRSTARRRLARNAISKRKQNSKETAELSRVKP